MGINGLKLERKLSGEPVGVEGEEEENSGHRGQYIRSMLHTYVKMVL